MSLHGARCPGMQVRSPGVPGEDCNCFGGLLLARTQPTSTRRDDGPGADHRQDNPRGHLYPGVRCHSPKGHPMLMLVCSWYGHVLGLGAGHGMEMLPVAQSPLRKGETISQLSWGCPNVKCLSTDPRCPDSRAQVLLITLLKSVTGHNTGAQRRPTRSPCPLQSQSKARPPSISELHIPWLFGWSLKIGPHSTVLLKLQKNN